ncbi:MAG: DsrE family protein [Fimbriimonadia bacterium]|jgi:predicted peroxiredoxin
MMKTLTPFILGMLACAAITLAIVVGATAQGAGSGKGRLFITVTTDDPWANEMAISYAETTKSRGYDVTLFYQVRGVRTAAKKVPSGLAEAQQRLRKAMSRGIEVYVCGMCSTRAGITPMSGWIEGTKPGDPGMVDKMMDLGTKVMSY